MNTLFRKSFTRDLKKIKNSELRQRILEIIESVESAVGPADIANLKKLAGTDNCFRIRVADYRIGIVIEGDSVEFVRSLKRSDFYRSFP